MRALRAQHTHPTTACPEFTSRVLDTVSHAACQQTLGVLVSLGGWAP